MTIGTQSPGAARARAIKARSERARGDLWQGFARWELWSTLGWHDIRRRYRRTTLGPFWITLSMAAIIVGIGTLYAGLFGYGVREYLPYLAMGLIVWNLIAAMMSDGAQIFINGAGNIKQVESPLSIYFYQTMWKQLLIFVHNLVLIPIIMTIFDMWPGMVGLLAIPGFVLTFATLSGVVLTLALVSARFRDVPPIVGMVVQFTFFFTPIIWNAERMPERAIIIDYNPFFYLIEVVRAPLLGRDPEPHVWIVTLGLAVAAWAVALVFYSRYRHRISYWV